MNANEIIELALKDKSIGKYCKQLLNEGETDSIVKLYKMNEKGISYTVGP